MSTAFTPVLFGLGLAWSGMAPWAGEGENLIYIAVEPCRIVNANDTGNYLVPSLAQDFFAYGTGAELMAQGGEVNGCAHPKAAEGVAPVAIAANVTAVGKKASGNGNIVAYPAGGGKPTASLVNFTTAANIANSTIIALCRGDACSADFTLEASFSEVPGIVDVQGYFYPRNLMNVMTVSPQGGDFTSPVAALDQIERLIADDDPDNDPSDGNRYMIEIGPGVYDLNSTRLRMQEYVALVGKGWGTVIAGGGSDIETDGVVVAASNARLVNLRVVNYGGSANAVAVFNDSRQSMRLQDVRVHAYGGSVRNIGVYNKGSAGGRLQNVSVTANGGSYAHGIHNSDTANPLLFNVNSGVSGASIDNFAIYNSGTSWPKIQSARAGASGGTRAVGIRNEGLTQAWIMGVVTNASGLGDVAGISIEAASTGVRIWNSIAVGGVDDQADGAQCKGVTDNDLNDIDC